MGRMNEYSCHIPSSCISCSGSGSGSGSGCFSGSGSGSGSGTGSCSGSGSGSGSGAASGATSTSTTSSVNKTCSKQPGEGRLSTVNALHRRKDSEMGDYALVKVRESCVKCIFKKKNRGRTCLEMMRPRWFHMPDKIPTGNNIVFFFLFAKAVFPHNNLKSH